MAKYSKESFDQLIANLESILLERGKICVWKMSDKSDFMDDCRTVKIKIKLYDPITNKPQP